MSSSERTAQRFTEFLHARARGFMRKTYRANKLRARGIGEEMGIRVPLLLGQFSSPSDIDFGSLPDRFVLKPTSEFGRRGVYLLHRQPDGGYLDLMSRMVLSETDIRAELGAFGSRAVEADAPSFLAEELIVGENGPDEIPYDYKFYTFDGRPELIVQFNRNNVPNGKTVGVAFFRAGFEPLPAGLVRVGDKAAFDSPLRPSNWEQMIEAASRIATHMDEAFISVDMYTTGTDTVLGELTPGPGAPYGGTLFYFVPSFDGELGGYWRRGLIRRGIPIPSIQGVPPAIRRHERDPLVAQRRELERLRKLGAPNVRKSLKLLWQATTRKLSARSAR